MTQAGTGHSGVEGIVNFDNAATAGARPEEVAGAVLRALREAPANPGRSGHRLSLEAARVVEDARRELAGLIGAREPSHVVFTKNATEALNVALLGYLREGDRVLAGSWEHNAVMRPLRRLARTRGVAVEFIPPSADSPVDLDWLEAKLAHAPVRLVACQAASNVTGAVTPIAEIGALCRKSEASLLVDAAQGAGVIDIDVERDRVDALAVTGHKSLMGPPGTGALYLREPEAVEPLICGGTGSRSEEEEQPGFAPDRFEAGTANVPGLAGLAEGIRFVRARGASYFRARHAELADLLARSLEGIPGVRLHLPGAPSGRLATVSFELDEADPAEVARELERRGVLSRPGLHCAPRAHRTLGTFPRGTVRFSLSTFNTEEEIARAAEAVGEVARRQRHGNGI